MEKNYYCNHYIKKQENKKKVVNNKFIRPAMLLNIFNQKFYQNLQFEDYYFVSGILHTCCIIEETHEFHKWSYSHKLHTGVD